MSNVPMDAKISCCIGKSSATYTRIFVRVWDNPKVIIRTKLTVYRACDFNTLLYVSKTLTVLKEQEKKINTFHHLQCLHSQNKVATENHQQRIVETYRGHHYIHRAQLAQTSLAWLRLKDEQRAHSKSFTIWRVNFGQK